MVVVQVFHEPVDQSFRWLAGICNLFIVPAITRQLFSRDTMGSFMSNNTPGVGRSSCSFMSFGVEWHKQLCLVLHVKHQDDHLKYTDQDSNPGWTTQYKYLREIPQSLNR